MHRNLYRGLRLDHHLSVYNTPLWSRRRPSLVRSEPRFLMRVPLMVIIIKVIIEEM